MRVLLCFLALLSSRTVEAGGNGGGNTITGGACVGLSQCAKFTYTKVLTGSPCGDCAVKVCLNPLWDDCFKGAGDTISHVCAESPTSCAAAANVLPPAFPISTKVEGWGPSKGALCQTGKPGQFVHFAMKDKSGACDAAAAGTTVSVTAAWTESGSVDFSQNVICNKFTAAWGSCSGNSDTNTNVDATCMYSVQVPLMTCGGGPDPCAGVNCGNNGACNSQGTCDCTNGFTGTNCDTPPNPCANVNCLNNGQCVNGVCVCVDGFEGADCGSSSIKCAGGCPDITPTCQAVEDSYKGYFSAHVQNCKIELTMNILAPFRCTQAEDDCTILVCQDHVSDAALEALEAITCPMIS